MNAIDNASKRATCQTNIFRLNGSLEIQWAIELTSVVSKWKWEREREKAIGRVKRTFLTRNEQFILHQR